MRRLDDLIDNLAPLQELETYLSKANKDETRQHLLSRFDHVSVYKTLSEWNTAVKICECLAIVGWGDREPLEASSGVFINGSYISSFTDKFATYHCLFSMWSKRSGKYGVDPQRSFLYRTENKGRLCDLYPKFKVQFQEGAFLSQENSIPQNPLKVWLLEDSCLPELEQIKLAVKNIRTHLDGTLWKTKYGDHWIPVNFLFESKHTNREEAMVIGGSTYAFDTGFYTFQRYSKKFQSSPVLVYLEKEFCDQPVTNQFDDLIEILHYCIGQLKLRLQKHKIKFDFDLLNHDVSDSLKVWKQSYHP